MVEYYAHTGISKKGIKPQTYKDHIGNVYRFCLERLDKFPKVEMKKIILLAALYHDLGKLHKYNQHVLSKTDYSTDEKLINHVDAGVAYLISKYKETKETIYILAAFLIHAHHIGLSNKSKLFSIKTIGFDNIIELNKDFRDNKILEEFGISDIMSKYVDKDLDNITEIHHSLFTKEKEYIHSIHIDYPDCSLSAIEMRFCLSLLVDADHTDSAIHAGSDYIDPPKLIPEKRIVSLSSYVEKLKKDAKKKGISKKVIDSRNVLFDETMQPLDRATANSS